MNTETLDCPEGMPADPSLSFNPGRSLALPVPESSAQEEDWSVPLSRWTVADGFASKLAPSDAPSNREAQYILNKEVGRGGFGEVWEGWQSSLGRLIAIKRIREDLYGTQESPAQKSALERLFRQEALTAAILDHPNILPIHDLGIGDGGRPLLAMKLVHGRPWSDLISEDFPKLSSGDFLMKHVPILLAAAQAVAFAHSRGIVHRDFKPSQVMVGSFGEVLLMDWGLAVCFDEKSLTSTTSLMRHDIAPDLESASNPAGTAAFMAPEQTWQSAKNIGPWTDVFLLGGTLYFLLTGRLPYGVADSAKAFYLASQGKVVPPAEAAPGRWMPNDLLALIAESMKPEYGERMATAQAFVERLQDHLSGASRHRESIKLTAKAREEIESIGDDYRGHESVLASLRQAADLWAANPDLTPLRAEVVTHYAHTALRHGDLTLARLQGERLPESDERAKLLYDVTVEEKNRKRRVLIRKIATASVVVLLLVIAGGGFLFSSKLRDERDEARAARDVARAARGDSEQLASFMLNDLRQQLMPLGKIDLLDDAALKLKDYYTTLDHTQMNDEELIRAQAGLVNIGIVFMDSQSQLTLSRDSLEAAVNLNKQIYADKDSTDWAYYLAYSQELLSRVYLRQGDIAAGLEELEASIALLESVVKAFPTQSTTMKGQLVEYYTRLSQMQLKAGLLEEATTSAARATELADDYASRNPTNPRAQLRPIIARHAMYVLYSRTGQQAEAQKLVEENVEALEAMLEESPGNMPYAVNLSRSYANLGQLHLEAEEFDAARSYFEKRLAMAEEFAREDTSNTNWYREVSTGHRDLGKVMMATGEYEEAEAIFQSCLERFADLLERDSSNTEWLYSHALALGDLGRLAGKQDQHTKAIEWFSRLEQELQHLSEIDANNVQFLTTYADGTALLAEALLASGDAETALEKALKAHGILKPLMSESGADDAVRLPFENTSRVVAKTLRELGRDDEAAAFAPPPPEQ